MVPLIRVLEAPPSKPKVSVTDDSELDEDNGDRKVLTCSLQTVLHSTNDNRYDCMYTCTCMRPYTQYMYMYNYY